MIWKTRRRGGMRAVLKPLGQTAVTVGKEYGKDWIKTKSVKVAEGIYKDPNLINDPNFMLYGTKPLRKPKSDMYDGENSENINPNLTRGGKTKKRNNKKRKTRRNRK